MPVTDLTITGIGLPDYCARGVTQKIGLIEQSSRLRRTVNGKLVNLSKSQFRKRWTEISCDDVEFPAVRDIWPGQAVTVSSIISITTSVGVTPTPVSITGVVDRFELERDEYGAVARWTLRIEES